MSSLICAVLRLNRDLICESKLFRYVHGVSYLSNLDLMIVLYRLMNLSVNGPPQMFIATHSDIAMTAAQNFIV